jgi:hypothetical protein
MTPPDQPRRITRGTVIWALVVAAWVGLAAIVAIVSLGDFLGPPSNPELATAMGIGG